MGLKQNYVSACDLADDSPSSQPGDFVRHRGHGAVFRVVDGKYLDAGEKGGRKTFVYIVHLKSREAVRTQYGAGHLELLADDSEAVREWLREEHKDIYADRIAGLSNSIPDHELAVSF